MGYLYMGINNQRIAGAMHGEIDILYLTLAQKMF